MDFWRKIPAFLWPGGENFEKVKNDSWQDIFIYFIFGILVYISGTYLISPTPLDPLSLAISIPILFAFFLAIFGIQCGLVYGASRLLGGQGNFKDMFNVIVHATTPSYLIGWIPVIGYLASFVSLGNAVVGVMKMFKLGLWRAVAAVLVPTFLLLVILFAILLALVVPAQLAAA